ncbi:MAG: nucleoside-diphosphate kinase [Candidatus Paceibacterota bacterium]|jgi:nucleoside-diphosphate kinase
MKTEKTFVIIKPDGVQRSFVGEIIGRIEKTGLKIVAIKMAVPTEDQCWKHYNKDDSWFLEKGTKIIEERKRRGAEVTKSEIEYGKEIIGRLVKYMTAGPVVMIVVEGNQSVGIVKKLVGGTEPLTSDVGTIRGDLTLDSYGIADFDSRAVRNLIHCTDKPVETDREIKIWMKPDEIIKYKSIQEMMLYDVNLDSILE